MRSKMKAAAVTAERTIIAGLTRFAEETTVNLNWHRAAVKTRAHVSGDALAWYVKEARDWPMLSIWETKEDHAEH